MNPACPGSFSATALHLDPERETQRIIAVIRQHLARTLRRRGLVIGLSGGIDSSVTAALAVRALGPERVFGLLLPERESASASRDLGRALALALGIPWAEEDLTPLLEAAGFYSRYQAAVREVIPDFGDGWKSKLVTSPLGERPGFTFFFLVAQSPSGQRTRVRLPRNAYLGIVAATNFKQRTRKMLEYYHADRLHFAVAGTPNRLEYDQGFFVKNGDGSADLKPIAHLYKTQVYQLADFLGLPADLRHRPPTTDTYSLAQGQDEFYFGLPYHPMDLCLLGKNSGADPTQVAAAAGLSPAQVLRVWADIDAKRSATRYLHLPPLLVDPIPELPLPPAANSAARFTPTRPGP